MASKPVQRSLKHLRLEGWTCCVVEKYIAAIKKRQDAFGFGDILACRQNPLGAEAYIVGEIALVQASDITSFAKRRAKILAEPQFRKWKEAGGVVFLDGWGKKGPRGARKTWQLRREVL